MEMTETLPCEQQELDESTDIAAEKINVPPTNEAAIEKCQQKILNGEIEILNSNTAEESAQIIAEKILKMEELLFDNAVTKPTIPS